LGGRSNEKFAFKRSQTREERIGGWGRKGDIRCSKRRKKRRLARVRKKTFSALDPEGGRAGEGGTTAISLRRWGGISNVPNPTTEKEFSGKGKSGKKKVFPGNRKQEGGGVGRQLETNFRDKNPAEALFKEHEDKEDTRGGLL